MRRRVRLLAACAALVLWAAPSVAQSLRIGVAVETTSIDPHFHNTVPNTSVLSNIFEPLIRQDAQMRLAPALAISWKAVSDTVWELHLRPGVKFHDGTSFTAADAAFTLARPPKVVGSPGSFAQYVREISSVEIVDDLTLRIHTRQPWPLLPVDISTLLVVPHSSEGHDSTADFNTGSSANGTGPFRFVSWQKGDALRLVRNDSYYGARPAWADVSYRTISDDNARVSALLAHDVDLIDGVPTSVVERLSADRSLALARMVTSRLIFLQFDTTRDDSPFVHAKDGGKLAHNPLRDPKVRLAISKALDRKLLVNRIMDGTGTEAGQLLPAGYYGISDQLPPERYDPEGARRLLGEAGYPEGFALTLQGPNNRYVNDRAIGEAVAQMLARIGIQASFDPLPGNVFLTHANNFEYSAFLWGWASETGEPSGPLRAMVATRDPVTGWGSTNRLHYSNPMLDDVLRNAMATIDDSKREALLRQATEIGIRDGGVVPILFQEAIWAMRSELRYAPHPLGYTLAAQVTQAH